MKKVAVVVCALVWLGCPRPHPTPPPEPTPPPSSGPPYPVVQVERTLRTAPEGKGFTLLNGQHVEIEWAYSCCSDTLAGPMGWPGFNHAWVDYLKPYGANGVHYRLGPFITVDEPNYGMGGAYLEINGKADLEHWNSKFWDYTRDAIGYAVSQGFWVEVDLTDGWGCKPGGYEHHPWSPEWNIQGEDARSTCGNAFGLRHAAFIGKIVDELGYLGPVIWQDGNEIASVPVYKPEWSLAMQRKVREREAANNYPVHMFGTNSGKSEVIDSNLVDYVTTHSRAVLDGPIGHKPSINNEHNPEFPIESEWAAYCSAKAGGATWGLWAAGMEKDVYSQLLQKVQGGCEGIGPGSCPFNVPPVSQIKVKSHGVDYYDATPLVSGSAYCRSVGFTDGRSLCSVRVEGDAFRLACEEKAMGGEIQWSLTERVRDIDIKVQHFSYQFAVLNHGSARVVAMIPNQPGVDLAKDGKGGVMRISR